MCHFAFFLPCFLLLSACCSVSAGSGDPPPSSPQTKPCVRFPVKTLRGCACVGSVCVSEGGFGVLRGVRGRGSVGGGIKDEWKLETKSAASLVDKGNAIRCTTPNGTHASAVWTPPFTFLKRSPPPHRHALPSIIQLPSTLRGPT